MKKVRRIAPLLTRLREPGAVALGTLLAFAAGAQTTTVEPANEVPEVLAAAGAKSPQVIDAVVVDARRAVGYTVSDSAAATKLSLSQRETPQSMTVMTRERLDDQDLKSLRDVLDNTPGIYSNAYDTERVLFYSRGFLVDTLMHDGVPATTNFNTGSIDETLDTAVYERIEIVRGATGLMSGAGSPAASVNVVRKHADSKTLAISLDLSAASWKDYRAEVDASVPLSADGRIRARAVAAVEDRDSYQKLYHKRTQVLYGIVDADLTPQTHVSLGAEYQENKPRGNTWGSFPLFLGDGTAANWPTSVSTATDWSFWDRKTTNVFGELRTSFDNGWSLRASLSNRVYKEDLALFYVFGYPDPVTGEGLEPYAYASRAKITENSLDVHASGPFELLGRQHELVLGYNGSRAKNVGTEQASVDGTLAPTGNFFQWDGSYPRPEFSESTPATDIKTTQDALYAAARISLADPLKLIAGARFARWKVDSFYVYDTPANSQYSFSKTIPYAGLVWDFLPQYSAFASYTGIFKPQNKRDGSGHYLDPINGTSVELGIKGEHMERRLNTAFTIFQTRQNNIAAPVLDAETGSPVLLPDGSAVSQAVDGVRTRGFEMELAGRLSDELQGSLGWTRNITKDSTGATIRTFIPATMLRFFATWEPRRLVRHLTLGGGVNWQSASSTEVGSPDGGATLRQGSVAEVSLMGRYQFTPKVSVQLNANNIFDRKFFVLDNYDNTYYGTPRNYALSLHLAY